MNPFYQQLINSGMAPPAQAPQPARSGIAFANPMQKMQYIMQAMTDPAGFVKRAFPDIPDGIRNDPNQILNYLQQSRGITDEQIRQVRSQMPKF